MLRGLPTSDLDSYNSQHQDTTGEGKWKSKDILRKSFTRC